MRDGKICQIFRIKTAQYFIVIALRSQSAISGNPNHNSPEEKHEQNVHCLLK